MKKGTSNSVWRGLNLIICGALIERYSDFKIPKTLFIIARKGLPVLIIHSVQKLLNTSHLESTSHVSALESNSGLCSWYARLLPSGFPGKMMVLYVHEPSLLAIICKGKTIQGTWKTFPSRLEDLLTRHHFPGTFVKDAISRCDGYLVVRTKEKSMLAHMNQMVFELEFDCRQYESYDSTELSALEDLMMERPFRIKGSTRNYSTPLGHWQDMISFA